MSPLSLAALRRAQMKHVRAADTYSVYCHELEEKLQMLARARDGGTISDEKYSTLCRTGLAGCSIASYLSEYDAAAKNHSADARRIGRQLSNRTHALESAAVFVLLFSFLLFATPPSLTGNVIYSSIDNAQETPLSVRFETSDLFDWPMIAAGPFSSVSISGTYTGTGPVRVFLEGEHFSKLIFAADSSITFERQCISTCRLESVIPERIRVELPDDGVIEISSISAFASTLSGFFIEPNGATVTLESSSYATGSFDVLNSIGGKKSFAIYGEGSLTPYLRLNSSKETLEAGELASIGYSFDLLNLSAGTYEQQIVTRLIPDGPFSGIAPTENFQIRVTKGGLPAPSRNVHTFLAVILCVITLANLLIWHSIRKRKHL